MLRKIGAHMLQGGAVCVCVGGGVEEVLTKNTQKTKFHRFYLLQIFQIRFTLRPPRRCILMELVGVKQYPQ